MLEDVRRKSQKEAKEQYNANLRAIVQERIAMQNQQQPQNNQLPQNLQSNPASAAKPKIA